MEKKSPEGMSDTEITSYLHLPEVNKLRAKLAVAKDHLDKKEIKRALEEVMTMGHPPMSTSRKEHLGPVIKLTRTLRRKLLVKQEQ